MEFLQWIQEICFISSQTLGPSTPAMALWGLRSCFPTGIPVPFHWQGLNPGSPVGREWLGCIHTNNIWSLVSLYVPLILEVGGRGRENLLLGPVLKAKVSIGVTVGPRGFVCFCNPLPAMLACRSFKPSPFSWNVGCPDEYTSTCVLWVHEKKCYCNVACCRWGKSYLQSLIVCLIVILYLKSCPSLIWLDLDVPGHTGLL